VSFRARLTLVFASIFGLLLVVLAVALVWFVVVKERTEAEVKTDTGQEFVRQMHRSAVADAAAAAARIGRDPALAGALRGGDAVRARARARALLRDRGGGPATRIRIADRRGRVVADVGDRTSVAPATRRLLLGPGEPFGTLQVAVDTAGDFASDVGGITGLGIVVTAGPRRLASGGRAPAGDGRDRVRTFTGAGFAGERLVVSVLHERTSAADAFARWWRPAAGVLVGFLLLAALGAAWVSRSVHRQVAAFLEVARRIARGDFGATVPTEGGDAFAALGQEFNRMSRELEDRVAELARQRTRLQATVRRIGESFGANLDRPNLLALLASATVDGVDADGARVRASGDVSAYGAQPSELEDAVRAAEAHASAHGEPRDERAAGGWVVALPLRGPARDAQVAGTVTVWRHGAPFSPPERELLTYLASQGGVSLENVALHETVQRQALTDELTGLANHRSFQETLSSEIERARRFGQRVGLVLVDIDDFKRVNDRHGHQVGDRVLQEVARCVREGSREVDTAARYGGEELALVLPGTDSGGAHELADRVRAAIDALEVPVGPGGAPVRVTASFGVAALPEVAADGQALIAAADDALYEAKRAGKNRTVRAGTLRAHGTAR
jgi:diguanylate cyclase (GGDEF)-like protein